MSSPHCTIGVAALGWVALATLAAAQPAATPADMPTGDVWIAGEPSTFPHGAAGQAVAANPQTPTGDVWPTADGTGRAAEAAAPQQDAAGREEVAVGSVKQP
jgi:hypothetical protein